MSTHTLMSTHTHTMTHEHTHIHTHTNTTHTHSLSLQIYALLVMGWQKRDSRKKLIEEKKWVFSF